MATGGNGHAGRGMDTSVSSAATSCRDDTTLSVSDASATLPATLLATLPAALAVATLPATPAALPPFRGMRTGREFDSWRMLTRDRASAWLRRRGSCESSTSASDGSSNCAIEASAACRLLSVLSSRCWAPFHSC